MTPNGNLEEGEVHKKGKGLYFLLAPDLCQLDEQESCSSGYTDSKHLLISADARLCWVWRES